MEEEADLYDEQVGDAEIGPEIVDEALHPSAVGRGVVQLDGVALPLEPEHGGERPSAGGEGGARPGDGGLVERLPLGPHPDPRAADRSRHEPKHERGLAGAGVLEEAVRERHGGAEAAGLVRVEVELNVNFSLLSLSPLHKICLLKCLIKRKYAQTLALIG